MVNGTGWSPRSWAWPSTRWNRFNDYGYYLRSAQVAHDAGLDFVFLSDHAALQRDNTSAPIHSFDPLVLFTALAAAVPDIGFLLTASTTYNSPYNLARRIATLDTISGGRVIFNAVANFNEDISANFGSAGLPDRPERYRRAEEFLDVVKKLWLSWDTPTGDAPDHELWDETVARRIDHHGEFFDVAGPLNVPTGPQGWPVISQAGASEAGVDLAGRHADLVYASLLSQQAAFNYRAELEEAARRHGRPAGSIRILPGLNVVIADTRREAEQLRLRSLGFTHEDELIASLAVTFGLDPAAIDFDRPLDPETFRVEADQRWPIGFTRALAEATTEGALSLRELSRVTNGAHRVFVGTPADLVEDVTAWWTSGAVDGFNFHFQVTPDDLEYYAAHVAPLMREAGLVAPREPGRTLRSRLGLADPRDVAAATSVR